MKKIKLKYIILFLIIVCILTVSIYSKINPVDADIQSVDVYGYQGDDNQNKKFIEKNKEYFDHARSGSARQIFSDMKNFSLENTEDYIEVFYKCGFKSNGSFMTEIESIIDAVPNNDSTYLFSRGPDILRESRSYKYITVDCRIFMCVTGLSQEEIEDKIRNVDISIIYKDGTETKKVKVEGIDTLESEKIEFDYDWI